MTSIPLNLFEGAQPVAEPPGGGEHMGRAFFATPPGASFLGYEDHGDHIVVLYQYPLVKTVTRHRVAL
jgi:hypothetical protein